MHSFRGVKEGKLNKRIESDDSGMAERGDMFWNRKKVNILMRIIVNVIFGLKKPDRLTLIYMEDGHDLSEYGFDTKALRIPGYSNCI